LSAIPKNWEEVSPPSLASLSVLALENCPESLVVVENGKILFANRSFTNLFGYEQPSEIQGRSLSEFVPGSRACTSHSRERKSKKGSRCGYPACEFTATRADGAPIRLQASCSEFHADDRELLAISLHDIGQGERRRVVRASDKRFQAMFDAAALGILQCTIDGRILESNPAIQQLLGHKREELRNLHLRDFVHPADMSVQMSLLSELASGVRDSYRTELRYLSKNNSSGWARLTGSLVRGPEQRPEFVIAMFEDVTENKRAEHQLREAQKMEAIGRLVGGVAHDFNNLLTGIMLYCDLLRAGLENNRLRHHAEEIRVASEHGAALIQQLLAVARQQVVEPQILSLNAIILQAQNLLQRLIGENIQIVTELAGDLWLVRMDPAQVQQIVLNLVLNARDAMPDGGQILLTTRNHPSHSDQGDSIELKVSDNGCGMNRETLSRLFEPFFTTKGPGRGNGLGLATVHNIVKQDGGSIGVESSPGKGTQVTIYLPRIIGTAVSSGKPETSVTKANQTILLVEDNSAVLESMFRILTEAGYTVVEAANAGDAFVACRNHPGEIHLLISDVVLPGIGGHQVAQRVRQLRPGVKVLFISGYHREAISSPEQQEILYFRKPFNGSALLKRINEVLQHVDATFHMPEEEVTP
jgi:PAS domain S-box-containing protein